MTLGKDLAAVDAVYQLLRVRAEHAPGRIAYSFLNEDGVGTTELTYAELDERARAVAVVLRAAVVPGARVVLLLPAGVAFVTGFWACLYAGATAVPAPPPRPGRTREQVSGIIRDCNASLVLTARREEIEGLLDLPSCSASSPLRFVALDDCPLAAAGDWRELSSPSAHSPALLQYTSGSTAAPKGVVVTQAALLANGRAIARAFGHHSDYSRGVIWLPPFHDMGLVGGILQPLQVGFPCLLLAPSVFLRRPARWLEAISSYQATTSGGPTFAYELCVRRIRPEERERFDLSSWEVAFCGAEPVRQDVLTTFARTFAAAGFRSKAFLPCYGLAEACLMVSGGLKGSGLRSETWNSEFLEQRRALPDQHGKALVSSGVAVEETRIVIVDPESGLIVPDRTVGEIWVAGPGVAAGYWHRPEESEATFAATLRGDPLRYLNTGDLGFVHQGELFVTGRAKELIILNGRNLYPHDLERTAERLQPSTRSLRAQAFAFEDAGGERLVLVQETDGSCTDVMRTMLDIRAALSAEHGVEPHEVVLVQRGQLPVTSSGKPQRSATKTLYLEQRLTVKARLQPGSAALASSAPPLVDVKNAESIEDWILGQLVRLLGVSRSLIDPRVPFSRFGLDSIRALELFAELERLTGHGLTPETLYEQPSIRALARHISRQSTSPVRAERSCAVRSRAS